MKLSRIIGVVVVLAAAVALVVKLTSFGLGSPRSLQGNYFAESVPGRSGGGMLITAHSITYTPSGYTAFKANNLKWHKYGKYYRVQGHVNQNSYHAGYKEDYMYYRQGNQLKVLTYGQYKHNRSFKGVTPFKLVHQR
ncbi:hypothetical protein ACFP1H_01860 [Secundilactobacillus hailunensis]|uniref:Uncharacterized protein n=1 Tax=Secundilactobacillus hailunensis TaxID=2559923 RepID=A0ABW1T6Y2_9LACO|nr:hypothetical protein [Secundilactobacillus hailunensis]